MGSLSLDGGASGESGEVVVVVVVVVEVGNELSSES